MKNHSLYYIQLTVLYTLIASIYLVPFIMKKIYADQLQKKVQVKIAHTNDQNIPATLTIPRLSLQLDIIKGQYDKNTWNVSENKAQFATASTLPNSKEGTTVVYGHNTKPVFFFTKDLQKGDKLYIETKNHTRFVYIYTASKLVKPTDTSVFTSTGPSQVVLLTCNGAQDQWRKLMFFSYSATQ